MLFVQIGREVRPRDIKLRHHKAVITGIKDNSMVVVMKQDKSHEIVNLKDVVLADRVYTEEELKKSDSEFYKKEQEPVKMNDFERFKTSLEKKIIDEMIAEKKLKN